MDPIIQQYFFNHRLPSPPSSISDLDIEEPLVSAPTVADMLTSPVSEPKTPPPKYNRHRRSHAISVKAPSKPAPPPPVPRPSRSLLFNRRVIRFADELPTTASAPTLTATAMSIAMPAKDFKAPNALPTPSIEEQTTTAGLRIPHFPMTHRDSLASVPSSPCSEASASTGLLFDALSTPDILAADSYPSCDTESQPRRSSEILPRESNQIAELRDEEALSRWNKLVDMLRAAECTGKAICR